MGTLVFLLLIAAAVVWAVGTYNGLVARRNRADEAWRQIDVQLKRRHDLIPNLVETVRGAMEHERATLDAVVNARSRAMEARGAAEKSAAEIELSKSLRHLFAVAEEYPQIRANENMLRLQEELANTENLVGFARQHYNAVVGELNTSVESFPGNLIAKQFAFEKREYFAAGEEEQAVPRVRLASALPPGAPDASGAPPAAGAPPAGSGGPPLPPGGAPGA
jgi:LemA protein